MTKAGINLIPGEEKASFDVIELLRKLRFLASFLGGSFLLVVLVLAVLFLRTNSYLKDLSSKISTTESQIKSLQPREADLLIIKNRLGLAQKIINDRQGSIEVLEKFLKVKPQEIGFEKVESTKKKKVLITVSSPDLVALNKFMSIISQPDFTKDFKKIEVSSITRLEKGSYAFVLDSEGDEKN